MKKLMIMVPNLQGGGQERIAALMSKVLEDDYEIIFLVFDDKDTKYEISDKARFININVPNSEETVRKVFNVIHRVKIVKAIRKREKVDFCFSMGRTANIINCMSRGQGKTIVSIRNSSFIETGTRNIINDLIYNKSDGVLCVSKGQLARIERLYPEVHKKAYVSYNPCDLEKITSIREKISAKEKRKHVIATCGRLEKVKCYKNLFNSVKMAHEEIDDIKLIVIGEGAQRKELESYIRSNQMGDYVELLGFKEEPYKYVAKSEVFVFASAREGFPNVIVEALASGTPAISTDCEYGPREILSGRYTSGKIDNYDIVEYGILTPAFTENDDKQEKSEQIFADAIIDILKNEDIKKRLVEKGIKRANDFSTESYRTSIMQMFISI